MARADVNKVKSDETALMLAILHCHKSMIDLLLKNGSTIDYLDQFGRSAYSLSQERGCSTALLDEVFSDKGDATEWH